MCTMSSLVVRHCSDAPYFKTRWIEEAGYINMLESLQSVFVVCSWVRAVCRKCFCAVGCCTLCFWRTWNMEGGGPGVHQTLLGKTHLDVVVDDKPATETFMQLSADKLWGGKSSHWRMLPDVGMCPLSFSPAPSSLVLGADTGDGNPPEGSSGPGKSSLLPRWENPPRHSPCEYKNN